MDWEKFSKEQSVKRAEEMEETLLHIRSQAQNMISYREGGQVAGMLIFNSYDVAKRLAREIDYTLREED